MPGKEGRPTYSDLMECLGVLRGRVTGRAIAYLVGLVAGYIMEGEFKQMLSYLVRRRKLERYGKGVNARYALRKPGSREEIVELKIEKSRRSWDDKWNVFTYDMPTTQNSLRTQLAQWLHEMGFAALGRSSWVSPYDWHDFLRGRLAERQCEGTFYYVQSASVAQLVQGSQPDLASLWDVRHVEKHYRRIAEWCSGAPRGKDTPAQRARARIQLAARAKLALAEKADPMLPPQLLPSDWPRDEALRELEALRAAVQRDVRDATCRGVREV